MLKKIHSKYQKGELSLRDYLAAHRTILANDRTWLGNIRTSLAIFVAGISFVKFFNSVILFFIGWVFIPLGILTFLLGLWNHNKRRKMIVILEKEGEIDTEF